MTQDIITTNRCLIQPLQASDIEGIRALYSDESVRKYLGGIAEHKKINDAFNKMLNNNRDINWSIKLKENKEFIGLINVDKHHNETDFEISYQFLSNFWGYGYAKETLETGIEIAIKKLEITSIVSETQCKNKSSIKLLQRLGMAEESRLSRFGEDQVIYRYTKKERNS